MTRREVKFNTLTEANEYLKSGIKVFEMDFSYSGKVTLIVESDEFDPREFIRLLMSEYVIIKNPDMMYISHSGFEKHMDYISDQEKSLVCLELMQKVGSADRLWFKVKGWV